MAKHNSEEEKRKRKTELQRIRRQKLKSDKNAYECEKAKERERWKRRVEQGRVKKIQELSRREKKRQRAKWVESARKHRQKAKERKMNQIRFLEENTPPSSPSTSFTERPGSSRRAVGKRRIRRDRSKAYRTITTLKNKLDVVIKLHAKYKAKYYRLKNKTQSVKRNSPNSKVEQILQNHPVPPHVKKTLVFHEVLKSQIESNLKMLKKKPERSVARKILTGPLLKKYNFLSRSVVPRFKGKQSPNSCSIKKRKYRELKRDVKEFFEKDSSSRLCPGKRDTITKQGIKKQKRLLNKPLKLLHKDFMQENNFPISYSLFCRLRPFWTVFPNLSKRDTCLCTLCENVELLVNRLKILGIIHESSAEMVYRSICCEDIQEKCLERKCPDCAEKQIVFKEYIAEEEAVYFKWCGITQTVLVSGKEKQCKKVLRTKIRTNKIEMTRSLVNSLKNYMIHISNRNHQYKELDSFKKNITQNEIVLHMDFSENYVCKYNREIQSMHFGGSKAQAVLHTVVAYYKIQNNLVHRSYCTISDCPRKDPVAILAHLKPLISTIIKIKRNITKIHFISDGPSTQYRNFKMFYIFGVEIPKLFSALSTATWNYTEKGHGKGAPDGVGGCLKRTADKIVSLGEDIPNVLSLVELLQANIKNIQVIYVSNENIESLDFILPSKINRFRGCLQTHQITWSASSSNLLNFRKLTCSVCKESEECCHYHIGILPLNSSRLNYNDVYSSDEDNEVKEDKQDEEDEEDQLPLSYYLSSNKENDASLSYKVGDYLVVRFEGKKFIKHFIGLTTNVIDSDNYEVKFLRKSRNMCFVYPPVSDIGVVEKRYIEKILDIPVIDKRGHHFFNPSCLVNYNIC